VSERPSARDRLNGIQPRARVWWYSLMLRVILARPAPEVIPDRALMPGCALGLAMFLIGYFVTANGLLP
jgi:hypothetical protein